MTSSSTSKTCIRLLIRFDSMQHIKITVDHYIICLSLLYPPLSSLYLTLSLSRDVNKDLTPKDQDKHKDLTPKDQDKDKDLKFVLKDKDLTPEDQGPRLDK